MIYVSFEEIIDKMVNWILTDGIKLIFSFIVLYFVFKLINCFSKKIEKRIKSKKRSWDEAITRVLLQIFKITLKVLAFISFLGYVGIETTSIAAAITSFGLALGLALQGSLSNFAGGVIILIMHPYKIGDYIKCNDEEGTVEDIKLFYTYLNTIDNKVIVIPNGKIADSSIINYSTKKLRRLDLKFNISYKNDIEKSKQSLLTVIKRNELIKQTPIPFISINEYGDKYIQLIMRVWCNNSDYWNLYYYFQEEVKKEFDNNDVELFFNEMKIELNKE